MYSPMKYKIHLNKRGDTIIEVLIVLTVLGLAIGISYATANRSLLNTRQAIENSIAENLVKSQIETIRSMAGNDGSDPTKYIYDNSLKNRYFCVYNGSIVKFAGGASIFNYPTDYPGQCTSDGLNQNVANPRYFLSISWDGGNANPNNDFTVKAVWDDVLGHGTDSVTIEYRIQPIL